jgi:hypothetical protein
MGKRKLEKSRKQMPQGFRILVRRVVCYPEGKEEQSKGLIFYKDYSGDVRRLMVDCVLSLHEALSLIPGPIRKGRKEGRKKRKKEGRKEGRKRKKERLLCLESGGWR